MKKHLITLIALSTSITCLGMENNKEELKNIIKHGGPVSYSHINPDNKTVFFSVQDKDSMFDDDLDHSLQLYDVKSGKIVKTSKNYHHMELIFLWKNKENPRFFATPRSKGEKSYCSLYDLNNNGKKVFSTEMSLQPDMYGFALNGTVLFALLHNLFKTYNLTTQKYHEFTLQKGEVRYFRPSPDTKHFFVYDDGKDKKHYLYHCDLENNVEKLLGQEECGSSQLVNTAAFNASSTRLVFFDPEKKAIVLYDTQKREIITEHTIGKEVDKLFFPNDSTVIYTINNKTFKLWNPQDDSIHDLFKFTTKHYMYLALDRFSNNSSGIIYFYDGKTLVSGNSTASIAEVYDAQQNKTYTIETPGTSGKLFVHENGPYAAFCADNGKISLYTVNNWYVLNTLTFENTRQMSVEFSPCGNYAGITYLDKDENSDTSSIIYHFEMYDIKNNNTILKSNAYVFLSTALTFYSDSMVAFKSQDTTFTIYNYKNNTRADIQTQGEITHFLINDDLVTVSSGEQTKLFTWDNIEFKEIKNETNKDGYCIIA